MMMKRISLLILVFYLVLKLWSYFQLPYFFIVDLAMYPFVVIALGFWVWNLLAYKRVELTSIFMILCVVKEMSILISVPACFQENAADVSFEVLNYNLHAFKYYKSRPERVEGKTHLKTDALIDFVRNQETDVVCFQEYLNTDEGLYPVVELKKRGFDVRYSFVKQSGYSHDIEIGVVTASRFQIIGSGVLSQSEDLNRVMYTDLKVHQDTIRVYNCHLISNRLRREDLDTLGKTVSNLQSFGQLRSLQVKELIHHAKQCPFEYVICGDFNATPLNDSYRQFSSLAQDVFLEKGRGIGATLNRNGFPALRIDYQFRSDGLSCESFIINNTIVASDHYPVKASYSIK